MPAVIELPKIICPKCKKGILAKGYIFVANIEFHCKKCKSFVVIDKK